jgi:hypothetical protein
MRLLEILGSSSAGEITRLTEKLDRVLTQYDGLQAETVADMVTGKKELADKVRLLPPTMRTVLINIGTGAGGGVVGQGLMLAIKALGL